MSRWLVCWALVAGVTGQAHAAEGSGLDAACVWLAQAVAADPGRDDAFGMFMRSMRPKCQGALEGLARGDGSVTDATVAALVKELGELRAALGEDAPDAPGRTEADRPGAARGDLPPQQAAETEADPGSTQRDPVAPKTDPETARPSPDPGAAAGRAVASGTWSQPARVVLDQRVKRTLDLFQTERDVQGELYEEVWSEAPAAWVATSCGGNTTFRMVTTARVTGEVHGPEIDLRRDVPRVLACTCPSRCQVEQRRRGLALLISPSGMQLSDDTGVFVREGAPPAPALGADGTGAGFAGEWETGSFERHGEHLVLHLALREQGAAVTGTLTVRSDQGLPLQTWSERFCGGGARFAHIDAFEVTGAPHGRELALAVKGGRVVTCTCPAKCLTPKRRGLSLTLTPDARSLTSAEAIFERR